MIPKPVMDAIDSNVRPQTEQMSEQIISVMPGGKQVWAQLNNVVRQIMSGLQGLTGAASGGGSGGSSSSGSSLNPLAGLMGNLGGR